MAGTQCKAVGGALKLGKLNMQSSKQPSSVLLFSAAYGFSLAHCVANATKHYIGLQYTVYRLYYFAALSSTFVSCLRSLSMLGSLFHLEPPDECLLLHKMTALGFGTPRTCMTMHCHRRAVRTAPTGIALLMTTTAARCADLGGSKGSNGFRNAKIALALALPLHRLQTTS
jgi:hypothetical protein